MLIIICVPICINCKGTTAKEFRGSQDRVNSRIFTVNLSMTKRRGASEKKMIIMIIKKKNNSRRTRVKEKERVNIVPGDYADDFD